MPSSQVSKEEYDTCRITKPNPRIIAVCDKPYKLMFFTITFRSFTPQPGGLEFRPGQDYYFICKWTHRLSTCGPLTHEEARGGGRHGERVSWGGTGRFLCVSASVESGSGVMQYILQADRWW